MNLWLMVVMFFSNLFGYSVQSSNLVMDTRTTISLRANQLTSKSIQGNYVQEGIQDGSAYTAEYLRHLSFPVNGDQGQYKNYSDPFPSSGLNDQASWVNRNYPKYIFSSPISDFLNQKLWGKIDPGDIIYIGSPDKFNYVQSLVLVGYNYDGSPLFSESNLSQLSLKYSKNTSYIVTWFDPLAILNKEKIWQKPGRVVPNGDYLKDYDLVVTVNLYDGTTSFFDKKNGYWQTVTINNKDEFFAVTGRVLPANQLTTTAFANHRINDIYDGDFGIYLSNIGVYQHTWTPQMMRRLDGFSYIMGFGGLNGGTDTSILTPQIYGADGKLIDNYGHSSFTIHRVPDVVNQDFLLRQDLLIKANTLTLVPIPVPYGYKSSGCVNYDAATWKIMKDYLSAQLKAGKMIAVIFSYPDFDQNLLPTIDMFKAAFTGSEFDKWCNFADKNCDTVDKRGYYKTYLDK